MSTTRAEIILSGGTIHTVDPASPSVEAVAIANGRVLAVGTLERIEAMAHPNTRRLDLQGRTLLPGFYDLRRPINVSLDDEMNAAGKLGISSLCLDEVVPEQIESCRKLAAEHRLPLRLNGVAQRFTPDGTKLPLPQRFESNWLRVDTVRLHARDIDQEKLRARVWDVHRAGLRAALTATTHGEIENALSAIEYASRRLVSRLRHRLDLSAQPPESQVDLCRRLGVGITVLPADQPTAPQWAEGLTLGFGSGTRDANPLLGIQAVVSQTTAEKALSIYTLGGAQVAGEDQLKGSISAGKCADLVVLSGDPLRAPVERIASLWVEMLLIDGRIVYQA